MSNIISYGIGLPSFRIEEDKLFPTGGKKGMMRSVCFSDEDSITLAYDALSECLKVLNVDLIKVNTQIDGIFFASSTPLFQNRYHASYLADLLNLQQGILALDFINTSRSGTDALLLANELIDSGKYKNILVVASEVCFPEIGKEQSTLFGHAACALLLSNDKGIANITKAKSYSASFAEEFSYKLNALQYDPRFSRDEGFKTNLADALTRFATNPRNYQAIVLNAMYARMAGPLFTKAGFEETPFAKDTLTAKIGNTGAVHALLLLINEIEQGKKNIFLADYTNGTNLFEVQITDAPEHLSLQQALAHYQLIDTYQNYLCLRKAGNFIAPEYTTSDMFSSEMMLQREKGTLLYRGGFQCVKCETVYYLKSARCKHCKGDEFKTIQLQNTGTVYSFTHEHYFPSSFPPITMVIIDLDSGGRMTVQQTDTMYAEKNKIEIGARVKLVLRKMIENDLKPNYFWKAIAHDE